MMPRKPKKVIELFIAFSLSKKKQTEPQAEQDHYFWLSSSHLFIFESSTIKKKQNTLRTLCNQPHKMQNLFFKQKNTIVHRHIFIFPITTILLFQ